MRFFRISHNSAAAKPGQKPHDKTENNQSERSLRRIRIFADLDDKTRRAEPVVTAISMGRMNFVLYIHASLLAAAK